MVYELLSDLLVLGCVLICWGVPMYICVRICVVARGQPQVSVHRCTTLYVYVCGGEWGGDMVSNWSGTQ